MCVIRCEGGRGSGEGMRCEGSGKDVRDRKERDNGTKGKLDWMKVATG